jgi:hypothetical protein
VFVNISLSLFIAVISAILFILSFFNFIRCKKQLDDQNKKLIQSYLHTKFLHRALVSSMNTSNSVIFCNSFVHEIKEYFNLSDFFVIDSIRMLSGENNTYDRSIITQFVEDNLEGIMKRLDANKLVQLNIDSKQSKLILHIEKFSDRSDEGDGIIICVEDHPSLLTEDEKMCLEIAINLLKTRLSYG